MAQVDTLLTAYGIIDRYTAPAARIASSTEKLGAGINKIKASFLAASAAIAAAGIAMGGFAVKSAMDMDTAQRRLQAFTGSAEEAARQMEFIKRLAAPSLFETKDLAKAATLLAAFGLNIEKVLPLADKLASAMGDGGESVSEIARVFGRLKSGDFGEAFERLRDFGISFDDLKKKGLDFSKSNQYLGNSFQALNAVAAIIEERFGKISALMQDSPAAKMASAMDALRNAGVAAGNVLMTALAPALEKVTKFVSFLSEGGFIKSFAEQLVSVGKSFGSLFGEDGFVRMAALAFGFAEQAVHMVGKAGMAIGGILKSMDSGLTALINIPVKVFNILIDTITAPINGFLAIFTLIHNAAAKVARMMGINNEQTQPIKFSDVGAGIKIPEFKGIGDYLTQVTDKLGLGDARDNALNRADEIMKKFGLYQQNPAGAGANTPAGMGFTSDDSAIQNPLAEIAHNTRSTAENTQKAIDFRRYALGGGDLGALGVSPVEMRKGRGGGGSATVNVLAGRDAFSQAMKQVAEGIILDLKRQGALK